MNFRGRSLDLVGCLSRVPLAVIVVILGACGGQPRDTWPGALCEARVGQARESGQASQASQASQLADPSAGRMHLPTSRVVVDVQVDALALVATLDRSVPHRVAQARGVPIGDAGRLAYHVDRGPFVARIQGDSLVIETAVDATAIMCKPLGLFGCVEYASCRPGAEARAVLPLLLEPGYRFPAPHVSIPITRRCTLTALDIDVTGRIQQEADREAENLRDRISRELPDLGPAASQIWSLLSTSVSVGGGNCVSVLPTSVVQTGPHGDTTGEKTLSIGVGVEGQILLEACRSSTTRPSLPAPRLDRSLTPGAMLEVGQLVSWDEVGQSLSRTLGSTDVRLGREIVHVTDVRAAPGAGGRIRLAVTIAGRTCGEIVLEAEPVASETSDGISLANVRVPPFERERITGPSAALALDPGSLEAFVQSRARLTLPLQPFTLPRQLDAFAGRLLGSSSDTAGGAPKANQGPLDLDVSIRDARLTSVTPTIEGLLAVVEIRGETRVKVRALAP